jgi:hypothetical protein
MSVLCISQELRVVLINGNRRARALPPNAAPLRPRRKG